MTNIGDADALGKSLDGRARPLRPTPTFAVDVRHDAYAVGLSRDVVVKFNSTGGRTEAEAHALAALLRAAPDLLHACEDVREALKEYQTEDADCLTVERVAYLWGKLSDAIAKAQP